MSKRTLILGCILLIASACIGVYIGRATAQIKLPIPLAITSDEVRSGGYTFINPLLECEYTSTVGQTEFSALEDNLTTQIATLEGKNGIKDIAVYFRDLNNGPWVGVNAKSDFSPASLLKVPVMMAYFKKAEGDPSILQKKLKFTGVPSEIPVQDIDIPMPLEVGKEYTVNELIEKMIANSDNTSQYLLESNIGLDAVDKVTNDLGITIPQAEFKEDFMSVRDYSSLFRILYNASYLSKDYSEKALKIMSDSIFKDGLRAGVPANFVVVHKFGERKINSSTVQLHDCGIVYYPSHPYLLCIMTRGSDFGDLANTIKNIAHTVESEVEKHYSH